MYIDSVRILCQEIDIETCCYFLGISRSTYYSWQIKKDVREPRPRKQYVASHVMSETEKASIISLMLSIEYMDKTPYEIFYGELDRGNYYCSIRTMYRLLAERELLVERRRGHRRVNYSKPELLATGPNQVWSWDITKLKGPQKWMFYYLYVILDIYSRYVVGWLIAHRESAQLAKELIEVTCDRQDIEADQLTIHSDRGTAMTSLSVAQLLDNLNVTKSLSRPSVSNDNPFSESHFKTLKYRPEFPERFGSIQDAHEICGRFFDWYNNEHYHSGLNYLTPHSVHYGDSEQCIRKRKQALSEAYMRFPQRFRKGIPKISGLPNEVWINKPEKIEHQEKLEPCPIILDI